MNVLNMADITADHENMADAYLTHSLPLGRRYYDVIGKGFPCLQDIGSRPLELRLSCILIWSKVLKTNICG